MVVFSFPSHSLVLNSEFSFFKTLGTLPRLKSSVCFAISPIDWGEMDSCLFKGTDTKCIQKWFG